MKKTSYRTTWNLGLMYDHDHDPRIEHDMVTLEKACDHFCDTWETSSRFLTHTQDLLQSLHDYRHLQEVIGDVKPVAYFMLARDIHGERSEYAGILSQLQERVTRATNKILFYEIALGNLSHKIKDAVHRLKAFYEYDYFLQRIWNQAAHRLSSQGEQILALKSEPAYTRWVDGTEKLLAQQTILWKGKQLPLHEALGRLGTLPRQKDRALLHTRITETLKSISYFIEHELNAIVTDKKINDELRSFAEPYSATVLDYENDEVMVQQLMEVIKKHQKVAHRLYRLKQRLMGCDTLYYADLGVTLAASKQTFSFEKGVELVRRAFAKAHPVYVEIFDRMLQNGQIDVYPRVGKKGGGYCWGGYGRPTYVLLNWTDDLRSVTTLAHEMGHAIHRELSKSQSVFYEHHPISTAEVASTLFENFVFEEIMQELPEKDRIYARFNKMQDAVATVFRQGAYFEFERTLHARIRAEGYISHDAMAAIMYKSLQHHLGSAFTLAPDDGYLFTRYMHARWFFYVYSYTYGQLISTSMYTAYQQDPSWNEKIITFLSLGGRRSPEDIFQSVGIPTTDPHFWEEGIASLEKSLRQLEKECRKVDIF